MRPGHSHAHENAYLPVKGLADLRQAVVEYTRRTAGVERDPDDVLIGPGSKELIWFFASRNQENPGPM